MVCQNIHSNSWVKHKLENSHTRRHSKLQVSFGPNDSTEVTCTLERREWKRPGVQPYTGQQVSADTIRWQTAPKPSAESGYDEDKSAAHAASFGLQA